MLIEKGANVNAVTNDNQSALISAAWGGRESIVRLLIENGANINAVNNLNNSALILALDKGISL